MYYFGFEEINYVLYKFLKLIEKLKISTFLNKITGKKIFGYANQDTFELNNLHLVNQYYGYWQKSEFISESKNFLVKALENEKSIKQALSSQPVKGSTALPIRRTDYIEMDEALSINFYKEAILFCKKNIDDFRYSIFTDDIEWVESQSIFDDTDKIFWQEVNTDKTVEHFSEMIKFENFIVGIKQALSSQPVKGSTALHIRRTDYIEMDEALSIDFYKEAIQFCKNNIDDFRYSIFTDDIDWVESQSIFNDTDKIFWQEVNTDKTVEHFSEMIKFENFIVGNSTFSLMAAIIRNNKLSKIIIADPWFRNQKYTDLAETSWIKIKNDQTQS